MAEVVTETGSGLPQTTSYGYDAAGATTGRGGQALTFDESGRLATVADGSTTERSLYTADGSLLMRWGGSDGASLFLGDTVLRSKDAVTTGIRSYTVAGITVAERVSGTGGGLWWLSPDPVGTVGLQINVATGVVTRRWMDPFGVNRGTSTAWSSMFGYLNAPASATGLSQLGARAYDPGLGRFVSVDPLLDTGEPRHANAYSYAYNSPVSYSDPTGLISTNKYTLDGGAGYTHTSKTGTGKKSQPSAPPPPGNTSSSTNTSGWSSSPILTRCGLSNPSDACMAVTAPTAQTAAIGSAVVHGTLTGLGLVPGVGEIADGLDALLCLAEGDAVCAGLSLTAMVPFFGWAAALAKFGTLGAKVAEASTDVAGTVLRAPEILRVGDVKLPAVPKGATGTPTQTGNGMEYSIPRGTPEISENVASVRIMDPVMTGKYQYPQGYAVYMNEAGQTINPLTGQTVARTDPMAHIPLP